MLHMKGERTRPSLNIRSMREPRRGVALVAAMLTIAILGLLAAGAIAMTGHLREGAGLRVRDAQLMAAVEYGLNAALVEWNARGVDSLAIGRTSSFPVVVP